MSLKRITVRALVSIICFVSIASFQVAGQDRRSAAEAAIAAAEKLRTDRTAESSRAAIKKFEEALAIWEEIADRSQQAQTLQKIGTIYQELSDGPRSIEYYEKALAIARAAGDKIVESDTLLTLGQSYGALGNTRRSIESYELALKLAREIPDRKLESIAIVSLGFASDALGDKQSAINYYEQALPMVRELKEKQGESSVLVNLGAVYYTLGEIPRAIEYYRQALVIIKEIGDERREATTLNNIGAAYDQLGDRKKAIEYYEPSLALRRKFGDRSGAALILGNIAGAYDELGDKSKAHTLYDEALAIQRETGARSREATVLSNIGRLYFNEKNVEKAFEYFSLALPVRREVGDIFGEARTLSNLAAVEKTRGNLDAALGHVRGAIAIFESVRASLVSQELRSAYFASVQEYYRQQIDILMSMHERDPSKGFDAQAFQTSEQSRARGLLDLLSEAKADLRRDVDPALIEREKALQKELNAKDRERRATAAGKKADDLDQRIQAIGAEYQEIETQIRVKSPLYASISRTTPAEIGEIQRQLDDETIILEYSLGADVSYLWVVAKTGIKTYKLPKRSEIEARSRELYDAVKRPDGAVEAAKAAAELGEMIVRPAQQDLGRRRLAIVADGVLGYIPFAALTTSLSPEPLITGNELIYLPSASAISSIRQNAGSRKAATKSLAVIADPVFDAGDTRVGRPGTAKTGNIALSGATRDAGIAGPLPRLPGTRREASSILALAGEKDGRRALDFDASIATVTDPELGRYRMIHFATHGLLNTRHPELSGIVLSLVDKNGAPVDGFLRLNDIYNLRLSADLVVLSACQTALGKEIRGEGIVGLTRGFMYAGASRIVASQWAVDDQATYELMRLFYSGMLSDKKLAPAAALRQAQIAMLKNKRFAAPYFWSAFALQGEWR